MTGIDTIIFITSFLLGSGLLALCRMPRFAKRAEWWLAQVGLLVIIAVMFFAGPAAIWLGGGFIAGAAAYFSGEFALAHRRTVRAGRPRP
jgi:hypothetical protein